MISTEEVQTLLQGGGNVVGSDGSKIGSVGQVFLDDRTSEPAWVTTKTGFFGSGESFVPLDQAIVVDNDVRVPFDKAKVKDAPRVDDAQGHLSEDQEDELYRYYDLTYPEKSADGRDTSGPNTDDAMTRAEERLHVGTETVAAGRARLRKYVVTENVTKTVPVSREEVRIEREPITDANRDQAMSGGNLTSEEHEVTLTEERPVVSKETVPVERVRLDTDVVTDEETVTEEVRKEQIEADGVDLTSENQQATTR